MPGASYTNPLVGQINGDSVTNRGEIEQLGSGLRQVIGTISRIAVAELIPRVRRVAIRQRLQCDDPDTAERESLAKMQRSLTDERILLRAYCG